MSATLAGVVVRVCTIPRLSVPTCAFIPKCQSLPFRVRCISGSRLLGVLGRGRRLDDRRIHNRPRFQQQPHLRPLPIEGFRYFRHERRTVDDGGCVVVDGATCPPNRWTYNLRAA